MPDDMLNFHKIMSDLQAAEEAMVENHKMVNEFCEQMLVKSKQLYNRANNVDYDQESESMVEIIIYGIIVFFFCSIFTRIRRTYRN